MKAPKADIDFLIQEKKRLSEGRTFSNNFDSTNLDAVVDESALPVIEENLILTGETEIQSERFSEAEDELQFDINDSLIIPADKPQTDEETFDLLEPSGEEIDDEATLVPDDREEGGQPFTLAGFSLQESDSAKKTGLSLPNGEGTEEDSTGDSLRPFEEPSDFSLQQPGVSGLDEESENLEEIGGQSAEAGNQVTNAKIASPQSEPAVPNIAAFLGGERPPLPETSPLQEYLAKKAGAKRVSDQKKQGQEPHSKRSFQKPDNFQSFRSLFESNSLLGLDIGSYSIKYAQVKKSPRGLRIINFGSYPVPASSTEMADRQKGNLFSETLRKNFQTKSFNNTILTSAVSGLKVLFKNIQIPKAAQKELAKAVPWACRKDLPFPVESTLFEYKRLDKKNKSSNDKLDVFVVAAQQDLISEHLALLGAAGIAPSKVSTIPVALWNLFHETVKKQASKCFGVMDIGANSSHIVFINHGQLEFAREISTGSADFTEALTGTIFVDGQEINLDAQRAEAIKRSQGFPDDGSEKNTKDGIPFKEISALLGPVWERLLGEVQRTIDFFMEKFHVPEIEKMYLTGGGALMPNLVQRLSRELNTPVEVFNPFEFLTFKKLREQPELFALGPRFAVGIGLALDTGKAFNLLPQQLKGSYGFKYLRRIFRYGYMIAILVMVLLSQNVARQFKNIEAKFKRLSAEYERVKPRREKFLALQSEFKKLNSIKDAQKRGLDLNFTAPNHLKAISNLIPRNITLTSFKITYNKQKVEGAEDQYYTRELLLLTGVAFENNSMEGINLAKFLLDLEKSQYFTTIALKSQRIREDGGLDFSIECES